MCSAVSLIETISVNLATKQTICTPTEISREIPTLISNKNPEDIINAYNLYWGANGMVMRLK